ncbi:MAG: Spx/MgsR family RNA polymerase-binding regulatory protein [Caldithrix sp.]|nr:Spx/MgsR family RNA polymerase-binding regulatory protein [Caldithrix sp.]
MIKLYGVPTCKKIRDTKALLDNNGIEYNFINVKKTPIDEDHLRKIVQQVGLNKAVNKKGATFRKLGLKDQKLNEEQLFQWLFKEQGMITRPLIEKDGRFWIDYNLDAIEQFVNE